MIAQGNCSANEQRMATIEIKSLPKFRQILESSIREYAILAIEAKNEEPHITNLEYLNDLLLNIDLESKQK